MLNSNGLEVVKRFKVESVADTVNKCKALCRAAQKKKLTKKAIL